MSASREARKRQRRRRKSAAVEKREALPALSKTPVLAVRTFLWKHRGYYSFLYGAFVGVPPVLIAGFFQIQAVEDWISEVVPSFASSLTNMPIVWLCVAAVWSPLAEKIREILRRKLNDVPDGWDSPAESLLHVLNGVVGHKETRFKKQSQLVVKNAEEGKFPSANEVFIGITNPQAQIYQLGQAIHSLFSLLLKTTSEPTPKIKVNITLVSGDAIEEIMCHFPGDCDVRSTKEDLSHPSSGIMLAHRSGEIVVVEDTVAAANKGEQGYVPTHQQCYSQDGSMICYPVKINGTQSSFVLSITWQKKNGFQKSQYPQYEKVLEPFRCRLRLEYHLTLLKSLVIKGIDGGSS